MLSRKAWTKLLLGLYPVAIGFAIIATGNHWFLDAFAGALLTLVAYVACTRASELTLPSRRPLAAILRLNDEL